MSERRYVRTNQCLDCGTPIFSRARCRKCRDVVNAAAAAANAPARFWAKVRKSDGCWEWQGARNDLGYARIVINRDRPLVHRYSYELHFGPIPAGMLVCHHCDNPPCVRPDHLFVGTLSDNARDMVRKHRHPSVVRPECVLRGERAVAAKLTAAKVVEIRRRSDAGETRRSLAREFGVTHMAILAIVRRTSWMHVPDAALAKSEQDGGAPEDGPVETGTGV